MEELNTTNKDDNKVLEHPLESLKIVNNLNQIQYLSPINYKKKYKKLKQDMKLLKETNDKLNIEIQDLTAAVFEEANKHIKNVENERNDLLTQLSDAESMVEVLNIQLDQFRQIIDDNNGGGIKNSKKSSNPKKEYYNNFKTIDNNHIIKQNKIDHKNPTESIRFGHRTYSKNNPAYIIPLNNIVYNVSIQKIIIKWIDEGKIFPTSLFENLFNNDIESCLNFPNINKKNEIISKLICYNPFIVRLCEQLYEKCYYMETQCVCEYKLRFNTNDEEVTICKEARNKIVQVAELWSYIRNISNGLIKTTNERVINEIMRRFINLSLVRVGFPPLLYEDIIYL